MDQVITLFRIPTRQSRFRRCNLCSPLLLPDRLHPERLAISHLRVGSVYHPFVSSPSLCAPRFPPPKAPTSTAVVPAANTLRDVSQPMKGVCCLQNSHSPVLILRLPSPAAKSADETPDPVHEQKSEERFKPASLMLGRDDRRGDRASGVRMLGLSISLLSQPSCTPITAPIYRSR
jgi:hypothetical protein